MYGHGVANPTYRKRIGYQAMLLGGMATLASSLLVLGDMETRNDIALRQAEDLKASLRQVLPDAIHDNDLLSDVITLPLKNASGQPLKVYRAHLGDKISAVAFEISAIGYAGPVTSIMGVGANGEVLGVRVLSHAETPGLGDRIELSRSNWILSFNGHSMDNTTSTQWHVKKDGGQFDQFTGATITPRAVVKSVYEGLEHFNQYRSELLAQSQASAPEAAQAAPTEETPNE